MPDPENENVKEKEKEFTIYSFAPSLKADSTMSENVDYLLEHWDTGLFENEEKGNSILESTRGNDPATGSMNRILLTESMDPLNEMGLCGGHDYWPSVDDMIETGNCIYIAKPDGTFTTYTDEFFKNNPTVEKLRELEKTKKGAGPYGTLMAVHLAQFLTESKERGVLKNTEKAFHGLNPADNTNVYVSVVLPGTKPTLIIPSFAERTAKAEEIRKQCNDLLSKISEAEQRLEDSIKTAYKIADTQDKLEQYGQAPAVPEKPTERSLFRRFICFFGYHHTQDYIERMQQYDQDVRKKNEYDDLQQQLADLNTRMQEFPERDKLVSDVEKLKDDYNQQKKPVDEYDSMADIAMESIRASKMRKAGNAINKAKEDKIAGQELAAKILDPDAIEKIVKSDVPELPAGSVVPMIDLMHLKTRKVHIDLNNSDELSRAQGGDSRISEVLLDTASAGRYMQGLQNLARKTTNAALGKKEQEAASAEYNKARGKLFKEYNSRVRDSKNTFKEVFGVEANVENVQKVIDGSGFKKRLLQYAVEDANKTENEIPKIPQVTQKNLGAMTLLLMSGLKTVSNELMARSDELHTEVTDKIREVSPEEGKAKYDEQVKTEEKEREEQLKQAELMQKFRENRKDRLLPAGEEEAKPEAAGPKL